MYNNYNPYQAYNQNLYTPNYNQMPQYQQQNNLTNLQNDRFIQGKMIENLEMAKTIETPLNGSILYMPLLDKSAIITKRLTNNGTTETLIYKPIVEEKVEDNRITLEDLKQSIDTLKNEFNEGIISAIDDLRKEMKKKSDK